MDRLVDKAIVCCVIGTVSCLVVLVMLGIAITNQTTDNQYRITVFNADGSINEIYETNRYSSAGPSIHFIDKYKGKITIFNCPTIIKSLGEQQVPLPPKTPPQDRTAEEEGRKAEKAGKEIKDNPYEKGTRKHSQWEAGWWTSHDSFFGTS